MRYFFYVFLLLSLIFPNSLYPQVSYYVDDDIGNDSSPGTFIQPFATIQKAADVMHTNLTVASCYIYPGTYFDSIEIFSNLNNGYMVFLKLSNDNPVLTGSSVSNHAFFITNSSRIIIQGLTITKYTQAILIQGISTNNFIIRNLFISNRWNSIYLNSDNADNNYILTNYIIGQAISAGISILDGDNNIIKSNFSFFNIKGIHLGGNASNNYIIKNIVYTNGECGI
ncbi:MAG: right-handed parallel beta-helix repeat-containing protein, partial [Spirochaetes bacterium]|nr:right-handed parallel beta-helix repeat-containing protein [Spirochaetota bacterium]